MRAAILTSRELDELRDLVAMGDWDSACELARLLAERGDLDELRARASVGAHAADRYLAELLKKQGRHEEAERLQQFGLNPDGSIPQ